MAKILLIDDDREMLRLEVALLRMDGNQTNTIQPQESHPPTDVSSLQGYDLILIDLIMPHRNGIQLLELIRKETNADTPAIICTGRREGAPGVPIPPREEWAKRGILGILRKPFTPDELLTAVHMALNGKET